MCGAVVLAPSSGFVKRWPTIHRKELTTDGAATRFRPGKSCLPLGRLHEAVEHCKWICICGAVLLVPLRVFIKWWQPFMSRGSHLQYSPCSPFIALVLGGAVLAGI